MSIGLAACTVAFAVPANAPGLERLLVSNTSIGEAHNFVDCPLSGHSIEDVLPPLLFCIRWMLSEGSATKANHQENVMKASIRWIKSVAQWKPQ